MGNKTVIALVKWLTPLEGGRNTPPSGPTYSTVAKFEESAHEWPRIAWSVVLEFLEIPIQAEKTKALVRFLVPNSPDRWLKTGAHFDLYEGIRIVAHVEVVEEG